MDQTKVLAFAIYEIRLLLSGHLGTQTGNDPSVRAAAHLAYALHNQALAVLEGGTFDSDLALDSIAKVDSVLGETFAKRFSEI